MELKYTEPLEFKKLLKRLSRFNLFLTHDLSRGLIELFPKRMNRFSEGVLWTTVLRLGGYKVKIKGKAHKNLIKIITNN